MNQSSEKAMTPKEQYDAQVGQINKERAEHNPPDEEQELNDVADDAEKILETMESKELDKNVGERKEAVGPFTPAVDKATGNTRVEVTREQYEKHKADQAAQKALMGLKNAQAEHLNPEQKKTMNCVMADYEAGILEDPTILALLEEKVNLNAAHLQGQKEISQFQRDMLNKVALITNNLVKTKGAIELTDKMILDRVGKEVEKE